MTIRAFELVGTVEVNTGKARAELNQLDSTVSRVGHKMERSAVFTSMIAGAGLAAVGVTGLTAVLGASGRAVLEYSSRLEQSKIAFSTLLGSADAATQHLKELQQFALKTPFEFEGLIDASRRLQAMGFNAKQVVPILTDVGNAVAAVGGNREVLDRVILALAQMQAKGRVATQEINQLAEAGIPAWQLLSQEIGKTRAETIKLAEQGEISADVFLKAFQKFSQVNFGGMMERQSRTFAGAMSNIKDSLFQTAATAFEPLFQKISQITDRISQEMQNGKPSIEKSLKVALDGLVEIGASVGKDVGAAIVAKMAYELTHPQAIAARNADLLKAFIRGLAPDLFTTPAPDAIPKQAITDVTLPTPLPANGLTNQQSALTGTNDVAEKTRDIYIDLIRQVSSFGDASQVAATKQKLFNAGVTDLNTGLAAQALRLAAAADAARDLADRQQAETSRLFDRNQDIGRRIVDLAAQTSDAIKDIAAGPEGRSNLQRFNDDLGAMAEVAGRTAQELQPLRNQLETLDVALANQKAAKKTQELIEMRTELSRTITLMARDLMKGADTTPLDRLQERLESLSQLKLAPGAFDAVTNLFKQTPDAVTFAQAMAEVNTQLQGVAGDLGTAKLDEITKKIVALFRATADAEGAAKAAELTARYRDLLGELNQTMAIGINLTERDRIEKLLLTDAYKGLTESQKDNLKLRANEADAHLQRLKEAEQLRDQLRRVADDITGIFDNSERALFEDGWKAMFREIGLSFADMLKGMASELMRSQVLRLLERITGTANDPGSESSSTNASINPLGALTDKLLHKLGVTKPKGSMLDTRSHVGGTDAHTNSDLINAGSKNTDRILNGQQAQTAQINAQVQASADRVVQGLTPQQEGFWRGLAMAAVSGAASGATSAALGGIGGGGYPAGQSANEGPAQPRPTTAPTLKPFTGRRAAGGPATAHQTYLIGEQGKPELLTMGNQSGWITPMGNSRQQSGQVVHKHYHFNVHAHGADAAQSIQKSRRQLARQARETLSAAA